MADVESLELQIKGNASGATQSINTLIKTLEKLEKATAGGCGLSAVTDEMEKMKNANTKVSSSNKSTAESFAKLATNITAAWITLRKVSKTIASWITESNEYVENLNLFTVSMGEYASAAQGYAESVGEVMGIDPSTWMRNQGVFMTLATGFGVASDRAATMSQQMTQLGYDISSFFNISVEEAMQKLKSGFSGELEPLRNLGYDLSQAKLEAIALSLGIDKSVSSMTQAEKAQLRYYAIMTQVTTAQGDMARTLDAPANQLRILRAQVTQAARALGNIFIPILNKVLPYVIALAKVVRILANAIAGLFGYSLPEMDTSTLGSVSAGAGEIADEFDNAAGSAAKLKKTLLGIDELNVMSDPSSGSGGSDVDVGGGGFDFDLPTYDFIGDAVSGKVNEIVEKMKEWLGLTGEINSWSDLLNTNLGQILLLVGEIGAGILLWKLSSGLLTGLKALQELKSVGLDGPLTLMAGATLTISGFTIEFTGVVDAIKNGLDGLNFAEILGGGLLGTGGSALFASKLVPWLESAFQGKAISYAIDAFGEKIGVVTYAAAGAAMGAAIAAIIAGIPMYIAGLYDAIVDGLNWLNGSLLTVGATLAGAGIGLLVDGPIGAAVGALIGLAVGLVTDLTIIIVENWDAIVAWCSNALQVIGQFFVDIWNGIVSVWNTVATWFNINVIQPIVKFFTNLYKDIVAIFVAIPAWFNSHVIQPVVKFFKTLWTGISTLALACWDAIVDYYSPAINWFSQLFGSIYRTISDIFYNIGVIASGCWEIIKAVWSIVAQWFNSTVIQPLVSGFTNFWNDVKLNASIAWTAVKTLFASAKTWFDTTVIQPLINGFTNFWNDVKLNASIAWSAIKTLYNSAATWFNTTVVQPVAKFFSNLWTGFLNGAKNAWAGVKSIFSSLASFFHDIFSKAWAGVVKVFSIAGDIFVDIRDGITAAFKSVVNSLIKGINNVVAVPFRAINTALSTLKNITILGLTPFSGIRTISIPAIPYLASGGVVDSGQMFVANEAGPELVGNVGRKTAVMNNDQIVDSVSRGVYQAVTSAMGSSRGDQVVEAKVNDKVLFEVVVSRARQETMRTGHNPLLGGV